MQTTSPVPETAERIPRHLGEYTIVDENNVLIVTELEHKIHAEVICEELNSLRNENESIVNIFEEGLYDL